jgi:penicillin-binding protein 1B
MVVSTILGDPQSPPEPLHPSVLERAAAFFTPRRLRVIQWTILGFLAISGSLFVYFYVTYARKIDRQLAGGRFPDAVNVYAAPRTVIAGEAVSPEEIAAQLRQSGYGTSANHPVGWYRQGRDSIEVRPGRESYFDQQAAILTFKDDKVSKIESLPDHASLKQYALEPQLLANVSTANRERRRLVGFADIPESLVNAVVSVEDKRFFQHSGFDPIRILKAAYVDIRSGRKEQGASTLSMQLARNLWLDSDKRFRRKIAELLIALHLESRLDKRQIFEYYANQVYLGRRGTFNIHGFGEAAQAFFGKNIGQLTLPESALLAAVIQRPSYFNPFRHPERVKERRDLVLNLMRENGYLTAAECQSAVETPIKLSPSYNESIESQYFIDLLDNELDSTLADGRQNAASVYTSLDLRLQRAAEEAIGIGMKRVDRAVRKREGPNPQVALVALDPRTGEIKALIGGRDYNRSQLNRALAKRQPGSVFKPFVYAAAFNTALEGGRTLLTPASTVTDEPTTFTFNRVVYEPGNYGEHFYGEVTLRRALTKSLNIATIKVAELAGYGNVVNIARRAGFNNGVQATPAVALGAYEATPLEVAGAYTVFANLGWRVTPAFVRAVRNHDGTLLYTHRPDKRSALDSRVAYLVVNLMEEVMRSGTAAGARGMGFRAPAAGKTGTSRDGWFAGFTSELLCVVWVGYDDNRDLKLEGSKSALPIWTEFMKRAQKYPEYSDVKRFQAPSGISRATIDADTGKLAGPFCPVTTEYFIRGTEPTAYCEHQPSEMDPLLVRGDADLMRGGWR